MPLYHLADPLPDIIEPVIVAAFDGWVDAGSAATAAAEVLAEGGDPVVSFDGDALFDYRSRRPTLEIRDGRLATLKWPSLSIRHNRIGGRSLLVLTGAEPDFRWHELSRDILGLLHRLNVREWISLGALPAGVPHGRPVPILGTESRPGLLRGGIIAGPTGLMHVPSAALSMLEKAAGESGIASVGYFGQIPHYVTGPYAIGSLELLKTLERHLDVALPRGDLIEEAGRLRLRLDSAVAADETTRTYVERLEAMVDEARLPEGEDLIGEIEKFLREGRAGEG